MSTFSDAACVAVGRLKARVEMLEVRIQTATPCARKALQPVLDDLRDDLAKYERESKA